MLSISNPVATSQLNTPARCRLVAGRQSHYKKAHEVDVEVYCTWEGAILWLCLRLSLMSVFVSKSMSIRLVMLLYASLNADLSSPPSL